MDQARIRALEDAIAQDYGNIAGIVVEAGGETAYERSFHGHGPGNTLHVYSVTKSVFSALMGIAIAQGHIEGVDQHVMDFFPDDTAMDGEGPARDITLRDLLTMTAPFTFDEEPYEDFFRSENWVQYALSLLGGARTGAFRYSPIIGAHILSGVLARAIQRPILDFARENLFDPLVIDVPGDILLRTEAEHIAFGQAKSARGWAVDPQGLSTASWGLCLSATDMAKIGRLYLQGGKWDGVQVLPASWVRDSTRAQSHWDTLAYGYLWWVLGEGIFAALGDGGNAIYVDVGHDVVVAIATHFMQEAKDSIALIAERIVPLFA